MRLACSILINGIASLFLQSALADGVQDMDGTFNDGDWDTVVEVRGLPNGTGSGTAQQVLNGGRNGGAYREIMVTRDPNSAGQDNSTRLYSFATSHPNQPYDPFIMGAIESIDISLWGKQFGGGSGGTVLPAVRQGGNVYASIVGQSVPDQDWALKSFAGLTESDFIIVGSPASHPDFSAAGQPLEFGFGYVASTPSDQTVTRTVGFDDWSLTVTPVPEFAINAGLNDAWYQPATSGQGFFIVVFPDLGLVFLAWFTFDSERPDESIAAILGEPGHRWLTAIGKYDSELISLNVELTYGGVFDATEPVPDQAPGYGTLTLRFTDCNSATIKYDFPQLGLAGTIPLQRIAEDNVTTCELLNAELLGAP